MAWLIQRALQDGLDGPDRLCRGDALAFPLVFATENGSDGKPTL
jgi:hypothetical protein